MSKKFDLTRWLILLLAKPIANAMLQHLNEYVKAKEFVDKEIREKIRNTKRKVGR